MTKNQALALKPGDRIRRVKGGVRSCILTVSRHNQYNPTIVYVEENWFPYPAEEIEKVK